MGDRLEARISAAENIQEEFGNDIREVKEHLARLTSLFEITSRPRQCIPKVHHPRQFNVPLI